MFPLRNTDLYFFALESKQVHEAAHKINKMKVSGVSKPEMAELKRVFAESRAKTINLFQVLFDE